MVALAKILIVAVGLVFLAYALYAIAFLWIYVGLSRGEPLRVKVVEKFLPGLLHSVAQERKGLAERMGLESFSMLDKKLSAADKLVWRGVLILLGVLLGLGVWRYFG